jgi:pectin methylesterase-like acyl-CoA thioesterase
MKKIFYSSLLCSLTFIFSASAHKTITIASVVSNSTADMVIDSAGNGNYTEVQAGINAIPVTSTSNPYIVYIKKGTYYEKDSVPAKLSDIRFVGEDSAKTIITYNDYNGKTSGMSTAMSYTLSVNAGNITFENLTIRNTSTSAQAVALKIGKSADRIIFKKCNITGYQDTYYPYNCYRVYHKNCRITGSVDFICGNGDLVFDSCELRVNRNSGVITAPGTGIYYAYGFVFRNCTITYTNTGYNGAAVSSFHLGRAWSDYPRAVFINCYEPSILASAGWTFMDSDTSTNATTNPNYNALFAEYKCTGDGFTPYKRRILDINSNFGRQISDTEVLNYTITKMFAAASYTKSGSAFPDGDWFPSGANDALGFTAKTYIKKNIKPSSFQPNILLIHVNPYNHRVAISYKITVSENISLKVYNAVGVEVATLVNAMLAAGNYSTEWEYSNFPAGVYFCKLSSSKHISVQKIQIFAKQ